MFTEVRKMHLIEDVLKVNNEATLAALESVLKKSKPAKKKQLSIYDFVGVLSKKESSQMKKAIKETCETINEDEWK